jgi:hypothetical protein
MDFFLFDCKTAAIEVVSQILTFHVSAAVAISDNFPLPRIIVFVYFC